MSTSTIPGWFTYVAWAVAPRLVGPFLLPSRRRAQAARALVSVAEDVEALDTVERVRVMESTVIPPLPGHPRYDLVALARGKDPSGEAIVSRAQAAGLPKPVLVATARNVARFGDTEAPDGDILLNHFAGTAGVEAAVQAWASASHWYSDVLHVDNSTLLRFEQPAPFLVMNYARIPTPVTRFMAGQILRPSFCRDVQGALRCAHTHPYPVFLKSVHS